MVNKLERLYNTKLDWAYRGKDRFVESLYTDEFKDLYNVTQKGKANVGVFGNSQVGKTTLILKLLGVRDDSSLHNILRGNRGSGRSVTPTIMVYFKSDKDDDYFYYKEFNSKEIKLDEQQLKGRLQSLRDYHDQKFYFYPNNHFESSVIIKIPKSYFSEDREQLGVNIVDLPGINSNDKTEHNYVNDLIKKVLPIIDITLVVESSQNFKDRITKFNIPQIDEFWYLPERFRLILTYTFKNGSEEKWISGEHTINSDMVLNRIYEQLVDSIPTFSKKMRVYPVEFGDSWNKLKREKKELYEKVKPINEIFLDELARDINNSISEHNRLSQLINLKNRIKKKREKEIRAYEIEINELMAIKRKIFMSMCKYNKAIKSNRKEIYYLQERKKKIPELIPFTPTFKFSRKEFSKTNEYANHSANFINDLFQRVNAYLLDNSEYYAENNRNQIISELKNNKWLEKLEEYINDLRKRKIKKYILHSTKMRDSGVIFDRAKKFSNDANRILDNNRRSIISNIINEIDKNIRELKSLNERYEKELKKLNSQLFNYKRTIFSKKKHQNKYSYITSRDLKLAHRFTYFIKVEFDDEIQKHFNIINSDVSNTIKLCSLFKALITTQEMQKIEGQML